ncbi:hypothetical protein JCM19239_6813 [Vibrio variabilis]|uniref:Uncharacterized protein n=1 Tax=Vibrio variabilis TaxID=990271 RepID=A0ABQ0JN31_9VIBR|nr:hypothetical protein JCM19239_6813 [Vibrio variabilis]
MKLFESHAGVEYRELYQHELLNQVHSTYVNAVRAGYRAAIELCFLYVSTSQVPQREYIESIPTMGLATFENVTRPEVFKLIKQLRGNQHGDF